MISFDEARRIVLAGVEPVGHERVPLERAVGRVLAKPIVARGPFPAFSASAMDGYAIARSSFAGSGPWTLPVVGESRMGALPPELAAGRPCPIFTPAPLPPRPPRVLMPEDRVPDAAPATIAKTPPAPPPTPLP